MGWVLDIWSNFFPRPLRLGDEAMNQPFTLYDLKTGGICGVGYLPAGADVSTQASDGIGALPVAGNPLTQYVVNREIVALPTCPGQNHDFDFTAQAWVLNAAAAWLSVRIKRDGLIAVTDWRVMSDSPLTTEQRTAWATYRQALRDITKHTDPLNIVWPTAPA